MKIDEKLRDLLCSGRWVEAKIEVEEFGLDSRTVDNEEGMKSKAEERARGG